MWEIFECWCSLYILKLISRGMCDWQGLAPRLCAASDDISAAVRRLFNSMLSRLLSLGILSFAVAFLESPCLCWLSVSPLCTQFPNWFQCWMREMDLLDSSTCGQLPFSNHSPERPPFLQCGFWHPCQRPKGFARDYFWVFYAIAVYSGLGAGAVG